MTKHWTPMVKDPVMVSDALVEKVVQATAAKWTTLNRDLVRDILAASWDETYGDGYEHGFEDSEDGKFDLMADRRYAPRLSVWLDGATAEQAEDVFDKTLTAIDGILPEGVDFGAIGSMSPGGHHRMKQDSERKPGARGTAVVTLGKNSKRIHGMWQQRTDGVLFFAFTFPFMGAVSAHHAYVTDFRKD